MVKKASEKAAETAVVKEAAKTVETTVKETKKPVVAEKVEKAEKTVKAVKEAAEKTVKEAVKKTAPKKTVKAPKAEKPAAKAETTTAVYVQFWGKEVYAKDVVEQVKKIWTDELKNKAEDLKDVKVYIKPEDNSAYYVINGDVTGIIEL